MIVCPFKDLGRYAPILSGLEEAIKAVEGLTDLTPRTIPLSGENKILVQENTTKPAEGQLLEAHREFLDIQYILEGGETVGWAPVETLTPAGEFNTEKDAGMYTGNCDYMFIQPGYCYVVFPEDAHMPGSHLTEAKQYKKLVIKLKV